MKTIYVVFKTARQVDGEWVFITAERAFTDAQKAEEYWRSQSRIWREEIGVPGSDPVMCECERGIHPVELQE